MYSTYSLETILEHGDVNSLRLSDVYMSENQSIIGSDKRLALGTKPLSEPVLDCC